MTVIITVLFDILNMFLSDASSIELILLLLIFEGKLVIECIDGETLIELCVGDKEVITCVGMFEGRI
jgi:hypothetical protein